MRLSREGDKEREQLGLCIGHGDTASSSDFGLSADWRHNCEGKYICSSVSCTVNGPTPRWTGRLGGGSPLSDCITFFV
jgi:hypothetical protein